MDAEFVDDVIVLINSYFLSLIVNLLQVIEYRFRASPDQDIGTDVLALDIQRGRDHGLAGYTKYLEICTGQRIADWSDLERRIMSTKVIYITNHYLISIQLNIVLIQNVNLLRSIYSNVNEIDLVVGGVSEIPITGATVGPTFSCIIGRGILQIHILFIMLKLCFVFAR